MKPVIVLAIASYALLSGNALAQRQRPEVVALLPGYACKQLNITQQQAMDPTVHIKAFSQPSAQAPVVGDASLEVAVVSPPRVVNGFEQALYWSGATVWIRSSDLTQYHSLGDPTARCLPARMSNGHVGFSFQHG